MLYSIRHLTEFSYSGPVTESFLEARMYPRTEGTQRCLEFELTTVPRVTVQSYIDYLGNVVHHFDVATHHTELAVLAESVVELNAPVELPDSLPRDAWNELDNMAGRGEHWDFLSESHFAKRTPLLDQLATRLDVRRGDDPLTFLLRLNQSIYDAFDYVPNRTRVDSPIDHALAEGVGVCQDFAHIAVALVRGVGIPCRYVSGYMYCGAGNHDRSRLGATHAWVEAFLPDAGWVGFDPTNALVAGQRHIRAAIGRDYADVPPTRGVFKGASSRELKVSVQVTEAHQAIPPPREMVLREPASAQGMSAARYHEQQQQQ